MAVVQLQKHDDVCMIKLTGRLETKDVAAAWGEVFNQLKNQKPSKVIVDAAGLEYIDGGGVAFLLSLQRHQTDCKADFEIQGLKPEYQAILDGSTLEGLEPYTEKAASLRGIAEDTGRGAYRVLDDFKTQISFLGELAYKLITSLKHPSKIRWSDTFLLTEKAGADAINITILMGFLIGLILAFQSAVAMAQFGAQIYVADLIVLTMFKEMGPLITAFILASRSGSAFAAEIGTMKVNEELDAMHTFGMDPVRFLAVPRVIALVIALPLLTLFNNLFALFGAQAVMAMLGFPAVVFWDRVTSAGGVMDLMSGLIKTVVFGYFIAAIGCLRGLHTGKGASAVGDSATSAVVTCIVMIVVVDGVFAVVYYCLGI